jgi:hypothetical protein
LVTELINYTDLNWQDSIESASAFMHRKDFLYQSHVNYKNTSVSDLYLPGRSDYIKGASDLFLSKSKHPALIN